jgi:chloride channel 7
VFFAVNIVNIGIVDVKCYLNGLLVQSAINVRTLAFRTIGATFAVGSGLLVGTEGPMVQAGVALAAAISRGIWDCGLQDLLDYYWVCCFGRGAGRSPRADCCTLLRFPEFNNDAEMRGFIACGAAAGLAAALGTPIGGLLYVLEDHHNFWTTRLSGRCLLSSICAVIAVSVCAVGEGQSLTAATKNTDLSVLQGYTLEGVLLAAAMGVMGGCFGSLFVLANTQLTALRHRFLATDMSTLAEVMALVTLGGMLSYGLPLTFGNCLDIPGGASARLVVFYCAEGQYNDLGSLFLADSSTVTSILFNGPGFVGNSLSLFVFCFVYAGLACLACGSYVSGGLFIPSLVFGGPFMCAESVLICQTM